MPLPSFTVTGNLFNILGDVAESELTAPSLAGSITFTPNVSSGEFVEWEGDLYRVAPVTGRISGSGVTRNGLPLELLANDAGLSVTGLQWHVEISVKSDPGTGITHAMKDFWFNAPTDGAALDLSAVAPVPNAPVSPAPILAVADDIADATATGKALIRAASASAARTAIGAVSSADITAAVNAVLDGAPGALDTLNELAAALGDDANFAATVTAALNGKQPSDATLTALAGVTTAANKLIYATAPDAFATTDLTAAGRALLDDTDAAAQRATLGAVSTPEVTTAVAAAFNPADIGYDVILLAGQSNEVGYGVGIDANLDTPDPRVWQWPGSGSYMGQIIAGNDPLWHNEQQTGKIGHAVAFARHYVRSIPVNRRVLLVPCAAGGTGFTTSNAVSVPAGYYAQANGSWDPGNGSGGTSLYEYAIAQANSAIASDINNRLTAILWVQGEGDRNTLTQSQYAAKLDALIDGFRSRITTATASTPFVLGQMLPELITSSPGAQGINAAHIDTPNRKLCTGFFYGPSGYDIGDLLHYSSAGQRALAKRVWPGLQRARLNVLGVAPLVPLGLALVQSTTSVTATWLQPLGRVTNFVVEYSTNGGSSWSTLTRTSALDVTNTITGLTLGTTVQVRVSTVNEQGTSAPCTPVSIPLVTAPGQPTGLTAGTTTTFSVPLSWTAPASGGTVATYLIEYKLSSSGTWLTGPTVAALSGSVPGLSPASAYDFRVTARNAAGNGTASSTANATTQPLTAMRTQVGVAFSAAYSLRQLDTAYAGSAIRVRRSSDSTEQDIGFSVGDLDTAALLTFCGAGDGFISKWYDQSGNAKDVIQATTTKQPKIVAAGVVNKIDSVHSAALFDGTASALQCATSIGAYAAGTASWFTVLKGVSTPFATVASEGAAANTSRYLMLVETNASPAKQQVKTQDTAGVTQISVAGGGSQAAAFDGSIHQQSIVDSGTSIAGWVDGAVGITSVAVTRAGTLTLDKFALGAITSSGSFASYFPGNIAEFVVFNSALNTTQRQNAELNQKTYYSTP